MPDKSVVRIEPHGVLRFAVNSTKPLASEMLGKVRLFHFTCRFICLCGPLYSRHIVLKPLFSALYQE